MPGGYVVETNEWGLLPAGTIPVLFLPSGIDSRLSGNST